MSTEPTTEAGRTALAPPCDCGLAQVYGTVPWGVHHAAKCAANGGVPARTILAIEAEAREQGAREERRALLGRLQMYALRNGWSHDAWKALDDVMRLPWEPDDESTDAP